MVRKRRGEHKVGEAQLAHVAEPEIRVYPKVASSRLSSKNQLTLPVAFVRHLGLTPGDELNVWLEKDHIVVEKRLYGTQLLDYLQSGPRSPELRSKEKIDAWIRRERDSWDREWDKPSSNE